MTMTRELRKLSTRGLALFCAVILVKIMIGLKFETNDEVIIEKIKLIKTIEKDM